MSRINSPPRDRQDTTGTTSGEDDSLNSEPDQPIISKLFTDAELYDRYLVENGCGGLKEGFTSVTGFADLIAGGLDSSEKAITGRLAKIAVRGDTWTSGDATTDPESYESDSDTDDSPVVDSSQSESENSPEGSPPPFQRSSTADGDKWRLEPEEIVNLLVDEFGPLAGEGEEEKLIVEADGALFRDIFIVGVIHLTTHRIAFHASLLSTRPDLSPQQQIVKAGPAIIHTHSRWHKKRRVWMEISHDMVSTYASSRDEDHIRPIRTVLLSNVKEVLPFNPKRPKIIEVNFELSSIPSLNGIVEFDTVESAQSWRREMQGALYMYRHSRRQALASDSSDELNGVRLSIPLSRIDRTEQASCFTFTYLLTLHASLDLLDAHPYTNLDDAKTKDDHSASDKQPTKLQFVTLRPEIIQGSLQGYIDTAKQRQCSTSQNVIIDFGPLSFLESDNKVHVWGDTESAIRDTLALGNESELSIFRGRIHRAICSTGYFVVSPHYVGFWSKSFASSATRYRLPISIIKGAKSVHVKFTRGNCLAIELEGQDDVQFDFKTSEVRDAVVACINAAVQMHHAAELKRLSLSRPPSPAALTEAILNGDLTSPSPSRTPSHGPHRSATGILSPLSRLRSTILAAEVPEYLFKVLPKAINVPQDTLFATASKHFVCLTIGSRGDVQPYIALGLGLQKEGHRVTIVTHEEYKEWVVGFGIEHRTAGGDPGALMKLSVENKMFSPEFFKESLSNFRPWLDQLLVESWEQCQDADVLLESPSAMAGVHIAEALNIPYFRCFTMPWTKTKNFPHAFLSPPVESPTFNSASYVLFDNVMWTATSGQINKWRRKTLKIGSTNMTNLAQSQITFIYNFSTAVVPKPLDWADTTIVSGYWFLDNPDPDWKPPPSLTQFMDQARADGKPIVYIGFGSITVPNSRSVTERIIKAVQKSGVRAIISKGWSSRMSKNNDLAVEFPPECYPLDKVPHDWLFPQIDAALHHGGAGTTGASLRAGIPTLIKPWFGDQYFWASRVQKLGAGLKVPTLRVNDLAEALVKATTSRVMKEKAASVGAKIRTEDGVHNAIHAIYTYLPRARRDRTSLD